uniref:Uncharacterized protein n=1 Tax=Timema poppense TaxID=170557 RepID=A0A7R9CR55_TIMPO|nr:unnamed protein product [Timema poppensis]
MTPVQGNQTQPDIVLPLSYPGIVSYSGVVTTYIVITLTNWGSPLSQGQHAALAQPATSALAKYNRLTEGVSTPAGNEARPRVCGYTDVVCDHLPPYEASPTPRLTRGVSTTNEQAYALSLTCGQTDLHGSLTMTQHFELRQGHLIGHTDRVGPLIPLISDVPHSITN